MTAGTHAEGIGGAAVGQVNRQLVVRRRDVPRPRCAVLHPVDQLLLMFNAHTHGKGLWFHGDAAFVQITEGVPGAVADGQNDLTAIQVQSIPVLHEFHARQGIAVLQKGRQPRAKPHFPAQLADPAAQVLHHMKQNIRAHMGLGIIQNFFLRAKADKLLQNPSSTFVFRAGVQLAVGKGSGAALTELNIALRVQYAVAPEALHLFLPLLGALTALQDDGPQTGPCKDQRGEHPGRAEAHDHRALVRGFFRDMVVIGIGLTDFAISILPQQLSLSAAQRHIHRVDPAQERLFPCVQRAAEDGQRRDVRRPHMQRLSRQIEQGVLVVLRRQGQVPYPYHRLLLSSPARCPDDQAHCRL